jgi:UDP-N-acetylmuramoyl-L-alanyl-D-glutamate--2,6-diaminopimelate ligase
MSMPAAQLDTNPTLAQLLQGIAVAPDMPISGIASDSRLVRSGDLFLACGGTTSHGLDYADDVIRAGAAAIAWDTSSTTALPAFEGVVAIPVAGLADYIGEIANRFYGFPSKEMQVVGVTGTNGKTTVAWLIAQCLERLGQPCAYIGTLGSGLGEIDGGDGMTTPAAVELHGRFAEFRDAGAVGTAIEVSSHALAQNRVAGVDFDTVLFTNLSRDHLDYHGDMASYAETKARLFLDGNPTHRVINVDSEFGTELAKRCGQSVVTVATNMQRAADGEFFVTVTSLVATEVGSHIGIHSSWGDSEFTLPLAGQFNVENAAIVLAYLLQHGVSMDAACMALSQAEAPPGRLQRLQSVPNLPTVYIDYAHTPAALEVVLEALREHCTGKLWCVFGCGGDRDAGKRPQMGQAAERLADQVVITNDNPRSESPARIVTDIVAGLSNADDVTAIEDRAAAIAWAIAAAEAEDIVLLAGKGHEDYQLIGDQRLNFSDYAVASVNLDLRADALETSE